MMISGTIPEIILTIPELYDQLFCIILLHPIPNVSVLTVPKVI